LKFGLIVVIFPNLVVNDYKSHVVVSGLITFWLIFTSDCNSTWWYFLMSMLLMCVCVFVFWYNYTTYIQANVTITCTRIYRLQCMQSKLLKAINKIRTLNAMFTKYSPYILTNTKYITSELLEWKYYNNIHIMNHMNTLFNILEILNILHVICWNHRLQQNTCNGKQ